MADFTGFRNADTDHVVPAGENSWLPARQACCFRARVQFHFDH
jgi:hypothetical protein